MRLPSQGKQTCWGTTKNRRCTKRTRTEAITEDPGEIRNLHVCGLDGPVCENTGADQSCGAERCDLAEQPEQHMGNDQ